VASFKAKNKGACICSGAPWCSLCNEVTGVLAFTSVIIAAQSAARAKRGHSGFIPHHAKKEKALQLQCFFFSILPNIRIELNDISAALV
jgi:hypothetical protein